MSLEIRTSSAVFKRAEQLRRWEDSDTNREPPEPKSKSRRIKFSSGCVFLAACAAGEKEEVLRLIQKGADIDTANVDGLTALHQACIDDNLDMVEFLVQNGADVNRGDNEGWTPLHATASCGFISIAKYLIENGADVAAINNDGELALDIAEMDAMEDLLKVEIKKRGIDCDEARGEEQRRMLKDAKEWAAGHTIDNVDTPHHKTGATALHVAAAKGYIDVINVLLEGELVDVDRQDADGWTPIHAAAHWGQREAAKLLVDNLADMDTKNYVGQTAFDVADTDMFKYLEDLKVIQSSLNKEQMIRKRQAKREPDAPNKMKKVELEIEKDKIDENEDVSSIDSNVDLDLSVTSDTDSYSSETETSSGNITDDEKKNRVNAAVAVPETNRIYPPGSVEQNNISRIQTQAPSAPPRAPDSTSEDIGSVPSWRRPASVRSRLGNDSPTKSLSLRIGDKQSLTSPTSRNNADSDVVLRRTQSFENDEKFKARYMELQERIKKTSSLFPIPGTPDSPDTNTPKHLTNHIPSYVIPRQGSAPLQANDIHKFALDHTRHNLILSNTLSNDDLTHKMTSCLNDDQKFASLHLHNKRVGVDSIEHRFNQLSHRPMSQSNPLTRSPSLRTDRWLTNRSLTGRASKESLSDTTSLSTSTSPTATTLAPIVTTSTANISTTKSTIGSPTATSPQPNSQVRSVLHKPPVSGAPAVTTVVTPATPPTPGAPVAAATPPSPSSTSKLSPGNIFKNFFKSFVPPVRDEESETQRKAHAKRVRETRRSTQGVTLDEIKSAEQLVKKKNQPTNSIPTINNNSTEQSATITSSTSNGDVTNGSNPSISATITTGAPTIVSRDPDDPPNALHERRPSWRLRVDNGSKFKLEDATTTTTSGSPTVFVRKLGGGTIPTTRPSSAPVEPSTPPADTVVTLPLRRNVKPIEDREQDKENDVRNAQATQAVIQRRRRPKRRSTGVVHVDMDEIDPDKQDTNAGGDYDDPIKLNHQESGSEKGSGRSSRLGSSGEAPVRNENGEIDYKRLWEQSQVENTRLRDKLRKSDDELRDTKQTLERINTVTSKNSLSELEKREKRAMERKLSEMEEELKQLEALKTENQRLKDENGALIRVISKLSK